MPSSLNQVLRLRLLGTELIIVIVGVIIALGIESWWSGLEDAKRERTHLDALHGEFVANLDSLNDNIATQERIKQAAV